MDRIERKGYGTGRRRNDMRLDGWVERIRDWIEEAPIREETGPSSWSRGGRSALDGEV